ncbi:MAG: hypothetical protein Q8R82_14940 [Hyphomonadaceae bacterium]|nr:hypothetical protein [Hyphomonadaceae bacterium]
MAATTFSAVVWVLLPSEVAALNDDFGYFRSVLLTIQHGRPWTDDWLEPWAAGLSVISAATLKLTSSFRIATLGLQAFAAGVTVWLLILLLYRRGLPFASALAVAVLVASCPTLLAKWTEFTGFIVYLPCLLLAVLAADARRWMWFLAPWALAVATRQSAAMWLVMPAWEVVLAIWRRSRSCSDPTADRAAAGAFAACLAGTAFFGAMTLFMNETNSQGALTMAFLSSFDVAAAGRTVLIGAVAFAAAAGLGGLALSLSIPGAFSFGSARRLRAVAAVAALAGTFLVWVYKTHPISIDGGPLPGAAWKAYALVAVVLALTGWLTSGFQVRSRYAVYAAGSLALLALRSNVWDYYLADIMLLGLLSALPAAHQARTASRATLNARFAGLILLGLAAGVGALELKLMHNRWVRVDLASAYGRIAERAVRKGLLTPQQVAFAPFGHKGWMFHPHFVSHQGRGDPNIAGFNQYLQNGAASIHEHATSEDPIIYMSTGEILSSTVYSVGGRARQLTLVKHPQAGTPATLPLSDYKRRPFPLNDDEWRKLAGLSSR